MITYGRDKRKRATCWSLSVTTVLTRSSESGDGEDPISKTHFREGNETPTTWCLVQQAKAKTYFFHVGACGERGLRGAH